MTIRLSTLSFKIENKKKLYFFKNVLPGVVVVVVAIIVESIASFIKVSILDSYSGFRTVRLCMYFVRLSLKIFPNHRCTFTDFFWLNCFFLRFLPFPAMFKLNLFLTKFFIKLATFTFYVGNFFQFRPGLKMSFMALRPPGDVFQNVFWTEDAQHSWKKLISLLLQGQQTIWLCSPASWRCALS